MAKEKAVDQDTEVKKKSGGNLVLIIVIVLLLLLLIGGGLLTYFLLSGSGENNGTNTQNTMQQSKQIKTNQKRSTNYMTVGPMYPMNAFIVNLLSENGSRFLKTTIDLEMDKSELSAELDKKKPLIRDIIIRVLSSKTFEEVSTLKGKDKLKAELVNKINDVLADGHIKHI